MPSGFFILLSYFLRVDGVLIRMNGTRFHYENGNDYMLKEYTSREAKFENIKHVIIVVKQLKEKMAILTANQCLMHFFFHFQIPPAIYTTPSEIEKHLNITEKKTQKLIFN